MYSIALKYIAKNRVSDFLEDALVAARDRNDTKSAIRLAKLAEIVESKDVELARELWVNDAALRPAIEVLIAKFKLA